jgi:hypothetical protein
MMDSRGVWGDLVPQALNLVRQGRTLTSLSVVYAALTGRSCVWPQRLEVAIWTVRMEAHGASYFLFAARRNPECRLSNRPKSLKHKPVDSHIGPKRPPRRFLFIDGKNPVSRDGFVWSEWGAKPFKDLRAPARAKTPRVGSTVGTFVGMPLHNAAQRFSPD